jgi:hypothetical protein
VSAFDIAAIAPNKESSELRLKSLRVTTRFAITAPKAIEPELCDWAPAMAHDLRGEHREILV